MSLNFTFNYFHASYLFFPQYQFLDSLVVRISACHVEGPGSIPGRGVFFLTSFITLCRADL